MFRNVFLKSLRDQRWSTLSWAVGAAITAAVYLLFYPSIKSMNGLQQYVDAFPQALKDLVSSSGIIDMSTPTGYLHLELFSIIFPLMLLVFAIAQASGAIAGEEERGTLELLLSMPLTRNRILAEKVMALALSTALVVSAAALAIIVGGPLVDMHIGAWLVAQQCIALWLLGLLFGTLALALGCVRGGRGSSMGVAGALGVAAYILNGLAPSVDVLKPFRPLSPFYHYAANTPLANGLEWSHVAILLGAIMVFLAVAFFGLHRRDIHV